MAIANPHSRPLPRGFCSVCGRHVPVRKGGVAREHNAVGSLRDNGTCPGSGKPVREEARS